MHPWPLRRGRNLPTRRRGKGYRNVGHRWANATRDAPSHRAGSGSAAIPGPSRFSSENLPKSPTPCATGRPAHRSLMFHSESRRRQAVQIETPEVPRVARAAESRDLPGCRQPMEPSALLSGAIIADADVGVLCSCVRPARSNRLMRTIPRLRGSVQTQFSAPANARRPPCTHFPVTSRHVWGTALDLTVAGADAISWTR